MGAPTAGADPQKGGFSARPAGALDDGAGFAVRFAIGGGGAGADAECNGAIEDAELAGSS